MVQSADGVWFAVSSSNITIEMTGATSFLGRTAVPPGNYTDVKLTVTSAVVTITNTSNQTATNETAFTGASVVESAITEGATVYASSISLLVSFNGHLLGGNLFAPTLTLEIQKVSEMSP